MTKTTRIITGFLGISMFMFGILKFINPFKEWYTVQVVKSELPFLISYWSGQIGEIIIGGLYIFLSFNRSMIKSKFFTPIFYLGNVAIGIMMLTAFYVHMNPTVPADVLPLKIRTPIIPGLFLLLAIINIYLYYRYSTTKEMLKQ